MKHYPLKHIPAARRRFSQGFSLIELLVAIGLGIVLMAGLAVVFANSSHTGAEVEKSIRQIENGRYAAELLGEDLNHAGYYGDLTPTGLVFVTAAPCAASLASLGWNNASTQAPVALQGLTAAEAAALSCLTNHKAGTPAVAIRKVESAAIVHTSIVAGNAYVQTSRCVSDPSTTNFILSSTAGDFVLQNQACSSKNTVRRYMTRIYYVASCDDCAVDTVPTLKRVEISGSNVVIKPVAEGIDDIAFDYAFDTDGDGTVDVYQLGLNAAVAAANTWANVVGVRIHLLSRTSDPSTGFTDGRTYDLGLAGTRGPFTDGHKRRSYTVSARLNNVAGPREVQP